jgi:hypothetical protein
MLNIVLQFFTLDFRLGDVVEQRAHNRGFVATFGLWTIDWFEPVKVFINLKKPLQFDPWSTERCHS